jgi:hypothetical protein
MKTIDLYEDSIEEEAVDLEYDVDEITDELLENGEIDPIGAAVTRGFLH